MAEASSWATITSLMQRAQAAVHDNRATPSSAASIRQNFRAKKPGGKQSKAHGDDDLCWSQHERLNLVLHVPDADAHERCNERHEDLATAKAACEGSERSWCGGVTRDSGLVCGPSRLRFELRQAESDGESGYATSWLHHPRPTDGSSCPRTVKRSSKRFRPPADASSPLRPPPPAIEHENRLGALLRESYRIAQQRVARGPPAFERFPHLAFRYRDWGAATRHGRGDAYPLYTLDTLRNLADHLFDASTGYAIGPREAVKVRPCDLVYSTLRPTKDYARFVHAHVKVPYLLISDTADEPITHYHAVDTMLASSTLAHWWAVDNEVLDNAKMTSVPLGVMDSLELGVKGKPSSVSFHAKTDAYLATLITSQAQPKSKWVMMQMSLTHSERRRVRAAFGAEWGVGDVRLTPESAAKMGVRDYLMALGQHRFVLSPRGNGLDAHRTWEALLVGSIPIVRSSALNPLYAELPVVIVRDWTDVTPQLLQRFLVNYTIRKPFYHYEKLFADYWFGQVAVQRERCLADQRASKAPNFTYDYHVAGGWVALDESGRPRPAPRWAPDAAKGG